MMPSGLTALLADEHFLLTLFEYLVDYGLHDCRLVCRKWNEVCKEFPVAVRCRTRASFQQAMNAFPTATSLSMEHRDVNESVDAVFASLSGLFNLKRLTFGPDSLFFANFVQPYFQSLPQLTDLTLPFAGSEGIGEMIASIRFLTNLTKLVVLSSEGQVPPPAPLPELEKIRELGIDIALLADQHGNSNFPSLTNLTRLDLVSNHKQIGSCQLSLQVSCLS